MRKSMLVISDIIILYLALFLTLIFRYGSSYQDTIGVHLLPFSILFLLWILVFYIADLYELSFIKNNYTFFTSFLYAVLITSGLAIAFFYLIPSIGIAPKRNLLIFVVIATILELGWRWAYNKILIKTGYRNNTLIVGLDDLSQSLYDFMLANPQLGYNALGIIDVNNKAASTSLEKVIREKDVKTLVISKAAYEIPQIIEVLYRLVPLKLRFSSVSKFSERITGKILLDAIDQTWFLDNLSEGSKRGYEIGKRFFDIIGSIIIGIPAIIISILVVLAIKLYTPGSLLYKQIRLGRTGKPITIIKFRTMVQDAEKDGATWATQNDPRITKIGKFLRKTRIDELPQLWNVIKGELSLVGPRPERPEFHGKLSSSIPFYEERYLIKPGIMGWAQLKYNYGASVQDTIEKLQYDLYYIKNRSLILDISIVLRTINIVLRQAGR